MRAWKFQTVRMPGWLGNRFSGGAWISPKATGSGRHCSTIVGRTRWRWSSFWIGSDSVGKRGTAGLKPDRGALALQWVGMADAYEVWLEEVKDALRSINMPLE